jgi:hypothetical protein
VRKVPFFLASTFILTFVLASCIDGDYGGPPVDPGDGPIFLGDPPVIINEIALSNSDFADEFGDNPGWVEFFNPSDAAVNLSGYYLTNSVNRRMWTFGDVVVEPRGYMTVFMSGRDKPSVSQHRDSINLMGRSIGAWNWSDDRNTPPGRSTAAHRYVKNATDTSISGTLTAVENAPALNWSSAVIMLVFTGWNNTDVVDLSGSDQIVFRGNISEGAPLEVRLPHEGVDDWQAWSVVLTGTGVEDDLYTIELPSNSFGFPDLKNIYGLRFANPPSFRGTIEISFRSIIARKRGSLPHASFGLSNGGGSLFLMDSEGHIRDSAAYPERTAGLSYAKAGSGAWMLSKPPTPGAANEGELYDGRVPPIPPQAGIPQSGYYESGLAFALPQGVDGSVIRCDTAGRFPTKDSPLGSGSELNLTATAIMRCAQFREGAYASEPILRTYIVGERLPSLPVVSIAVDPYDMFDAREGLYATGPNAGSEMPHYGANYWRETELPIHIDFFEGGARHAWSYPAGLRIFGNYSRMHPKKSVLITFREMYGGPNNLRYPMFPEHPQLTRFKHLILRNNGNNYGLDYIRDMLMTSLTGGFQMDDPKGLDIEYQKGRAAIVFYNGRYYGIHNIRERSNSDYFETNFGIDEEFIDLVKGGNDVSNGSNMDYQDIARWLEGVSLEDGANLAELARRIDVDNYTSYIQSEIYYVNTDWPGNNLKRWRSNAPPSRWRWFLYDTDFGFEYRWNDNKNARMLEFITDPAGPDWPNPPHATLLARKLFENAGYRHAFINRFSLLIATYFETGRVEARIDALMAPIESEIPLDQRRWNHSASTMSQELATIRNFARSRPARMQGEMESFFDLGGPADFTVSRSGEGKIFVHNLQVPNGRATFKAYASIPIALKAEPSPGAVFEGWSDGVTEAERTVTIDGPITLEARFRSASF